MQDTNDGGAAAFQVLLNAIAEPVCGLDRAGRVILCNDAFLQIMGYGAEEVLGNSLHKMAHHRRGSEVRLQTEDCPLCATCCHEQELHIVGEMLWRKDGTSFPTEYWARSAHSPSGRTEWIVTFHDIGECIRMKETLRRTQVYLDESQRQMHIGSWAWKTNQREKVYWSAEHYRIFGMEPQNEDLGFQESLQKIHPEDLGSFRQLVRDSIEGKRGYETELRIIRPDGSIRNIRGTGNPLFDQQGNVIEFVGTTTDITEQKRAEKELRLAQFSLEHDASAVHWVNSSGRIVYANQGTCRTLGYSREELASLSLMDIAPPLTKERWAEFWEALKAKGAMTLESENKSKEGRIFPVEVNTTYLEFDGQEYVFAFVRDISDRKQIEQRLRTLSSAVEQSPASVVITDPQGTILYVNPKFTQLTGYTLEEVVGQNPSILKSGIQPPEVYKELWSTILAGKEWRGELANRKKNGEIYWEAASIVPIKSSSGVITRLLAVKEDITERKRAESTLRASEKRYRLLFERNLAGVFRTTLDGRILQCNQAAARILGFNSGEDVLSLSASSFYEKSSDRDAFIKELTSKKSLSNREMKYRRKDGELVSVIANFSLVEDNSDLGPVILGTFVDITKRRAAEERIQALAYYDALTGLPNRTLLRDRLSQALALARRHNHKVALLFIDLDRFKIINDSLGHAVGDLLLKEVSIRLKKCVRESDTVARLGGDEFVIVLSHLKEAHHTAITAERVMKALTDTFDVQGHALNISCSLGISIYPDHAMDSETLIKNADAAMYTAKEAGRNNSQLFTANMSSNAAERLQLESGLRLALQRREFFLHYQPQMEIASGKIAGLEALLRWQHPELGLVPPGEFIEIAETSGLIVPIGEWVLRTACRDAGEWLRAGMLSAPVAVNVSALQLQQEGFCKMIGTVLKEANLMPEFLQLELTETVLLARPELMRSVVQELKGMGITLAIDDFGTGYSSFGYLRKLRVDKLKIDGVFIRDVAKNTDDAAITAAIISMAKSLRLKVVAEGVENEAQLSFLRTNRCDEIQGYYFSKPLPADGISEFLTNRISGQESPIVQD